MRRLPLVVGLATILLSAPAPTFNGRWCPGAPPCNGACCPGSDDAGPAGPRSGYEDQPGGGPTWAGDPIMLADLNSYQRIMDVASDDANGRLPFFRSYTSSYLTWDYSWFDPRNGQWGEIKGVPKPFGTDPSSAGGLRWWHNYYSYAMALYSQSGWVWLVRN